MAKKSKQLSMINKDYGINKIVYWLITILSVLGPLWVGFYFESPKLITGSILSLGFVFFCWQQYKKNKPLQISLLKGFLLMFLFINFLSLLTAINKHSALIESILVVGYVLTFNYFSQITAIQIKKFLNLLLASGTIVAILGLASYTGLVNFENTSRLGLRLQSTLENANIAAIFLLICYLYSILVNSNRANNLDHGLNKLSGRLPYIISFSSSIISFALLLTYSRGVFLLFIPLYLLLHLLSQKEIRNKLFFNLLTSFLPSIIFIQLFSYFTDEKQLLLAWLILVLNIALGILSQNWLQQNETWLRTKLRPLYLGLAAIIFLSILSTTHNNNPVLQRVASISTKAETAIERFEMYHDAWQIIKEHPLLGVGEGGWQSLYPSYQTKAYVSKEVHSNLLKIGINTGILGVLFYLGFWTTFLIYVIKALKYKEKTIDDDYQLLAYLVVAALGLLLHSQIDFDLSLPSISILLWGLGGGAMALSSKFLKQETSILNNALVLNNKKYKLLIVGALGIGFVISVSLGLGNHYGTRGIQEVKQGAYSSGLANLETAHIFAPFNDQYYLYQAYTLEKVSPNGTEAIEMGFSKALALNPYSTDNNMVYGEYLINKGELQKGIAYLDKAYRLAPMNYRAYPHLARIYREAEQLAEEKNQKDIAEKADSQIKLLFDKLNEIQDEEIKKQLEQYIKE